MSSSLSSVPFNAYLRVSRHVVGRVLYFFPTQEDSDQSSEGLFSTSKITVMGRRRGHINPEPASKTRLETQTTRQQKLSLRRKTKWTAISSSMLAPPFCAKWEVPVGTLPSPTGSRKIEFPPTTFHRHHNQQDRACASARSDELRIRAVLPSTCCV